MPELPETSAIEAVENATTDAPEPETPAATTETPSTEEASSEPATPPEPSKDDPRSRALAKQLRREKELLDDRAKFRDEQAAHTAEVQRFEEQRKTIETERAANAQLRSQLQQVITAMRDDPIVFLREVFGIGPEEYYQRAVNGGRPGPEEQLNTKLSATERELAELRAWRQQVEREAKERQEADRQAAEEAKARAEQDAALELYERAKGEFLEVAKDGTKYPLLSRYPEQVIFEMIPQIVANLGDAADTMQYADLANLIESSLRDWHSQFGSPLEPAAVQTEAAKEKTPPPVKTEPEIPLPRKAVANVQKIHRDPLPTLSNDLSGRTSVATRGSREAERKALIADLERAAR